MKRSQNIAAIIDALRAAEVSYSEQIAAAQDTCDHACILERKGGMTGYRYIDNRWEPPVRVCACCGYVEESRSGWPTPRTEDTPLYNTNPKSKSRLNRVDFEIDQDRLVKEIVQR